jgi:hypothetical protein
MFINGADTSKLPAFFPMIRQGRLYLLPGVTQNTADCPPEDLAILVKNGNRKAKM